MLTGLGMPVELVTQSGNGSLNTKVNIMNTPLVDLLTEAKALIADESNWTQGAYAKNAEGFTVDNLAEEATCFCSLGALHRAATKLAFEVDSFYVERLAIDVLHTVIHKSTGFRSIAVYNDDSHREHSEIIRTFDLAIEQANKGVAQ